ncbi:hypothetical protein HAX54_022587, partial [Datura stramonium]|nr:hypothetical protein [Datura stramonium]
AIARLDATSEPTDAAAHFRETGSILPLFVLLPLSTHSEYPIQAAESNQPPRPAQVGVFYKHRRAKAGFMPSAFSQNSIRL